MDEDKIFEEAERLCVLASKDDRFLKEFEEANKRAITLEHNGWKRRTGMTQNQIILKHLQKAGSITQREAIMDHSIQSLTKRIAELREAGWPINGDWKTHPITGQKYMRYSLVKESV